MNINEVKGTSKSPTTTTTEESLFGDEQQLEMNFDHVGGNRLQNILEMDLPRPKVLLGHHAYDAGQGAIAGSSLSTISESLCRIDS